MRKVSEHFSLSEATCHCGCGQATIDKKLYEILELFRSYIGDKPMITHCINRCQKHNKNVGGVKNSQHVGGHAWDGHVAGLTTKELHELALSAYKNNILPGGLGLYDWGIHIDSGKKRKW